MKMDSLFLFVLLVVLFCQCKSQEFATGSSRNGKCYAKCIMPDEEYIEVEEYAEYTGNGEEDVKVIEKKIVIKPAQKGWVKKKADKNCLSADPEDCMVWCLVDEAAETRTVRILVDTMQSKHFKIERVERKIGEKKGGHFEWKEVVCEKDLTGLLLSQIQQSLMDQQFYNGPINGEFDMLTKKALRDFQTKNQLPVGQVDLESLDVLGVAVD